jgi:hypothetical protein
MKIDGGDFLEYKQRAQELYFDHALRRRIAAQCREHAAGKPCNRAEHLLTAVKGSRITAEINR